MALDASAENLPAGFVYLHEIDPTIKQNLENATENNLLGVVVDGYEGDQVICTQETAVALASVQKKLKARGFSLLILDAYRPSKAVEHIKRWAHDLDDQETKAQYYPDIDKEELLGTFLAAKRSSHSRGSTVDVLIVDEKTKRPLDFGLMFFGEVSGTYSKNISKQQSANRLFLREVMVVHNFKPYDAEFWHFTYKDEPFPEIYFDFPIRNADS